jgi:hypothetical protein
MNKRQSKDGKYTFIAEVDEQDPDSGDPVHVEIWKDNSTGGVFAIDSSFLEQVDHFYNPFNGEMEETAEYLPEP